MSIADELRKWFDRYTMRKDVYDELTAIADRIDAAHEEAIQREHETAYDKGYDEGYASADDWLAEHEDAMAEHGWYRAVDADKQPVRIGAAMDSDCYEDGTVVGLQFFNTANKTPRVLIAIRPHGWDTPTWHDPEDYRHHHAPTVEDVLREFADEVRRCCDSEQTIAEYAAKLRLAGDAE